MQKYEESLDYFFEAVKCYKKYEGEGGHYCLMTYKILLSFL